MEKEILRLFKAYLGEKTKDINEKALHYGLLIPNSANIQVIDEAIIQYGKDGEKWNQTFHKKLSTIKNSSEDELIAQEIIQYFTTYGFEKLGIYSKEKVYIPKEELNVPELEIDNIELIVISPITEEELGLRLMNLITSGIALSEQTLKDVITLSEYIDINRIDEIKNRELKIALYDKYNIVPKNPDEFLRYLIYTLTSDTLKIQNRVLFKKIKLSNKSVACKLLESYLVDENAYNKLSSIFLRNKKIFLALKVKKNRIFIGKKEDGIKINRIINKLRKLADKNHKPIKKDVLDVLTQDIDIENKEILSALDKVTVFREVRILNGLAYRINCTDDIVYKIRNGSSYATKLKPKTEKYIKLLEKRHDFIKEHLISRISNNVKGKKIFIPENVTYTVPTSEKQFNGNFPNGSYIEVSRKDSLVYGIHWTNLEGNSHERRVDLDIKQMNRNEVFGWDGCQKDNDGDIIFSGDITDAPLPNGATEVFYIGQDYKNNAFLITVNNYTCNSKDIPFEFIIAKAEKNAQFAEDRDYILNPNDIIEKLNLVVSSRNQQCVVGCITIGDNIRLYLSDFGQGNARTSINDDTAIITLNYIQAFARVQLKLNELLKESGAILTDSAEDVDYDLSVNSITKDTLISLLNDNN